MIDVPYRNLKYLMSAYFHEDWDHTHETWEEVVDAFMSDNPSIVEAVPDEIDELLSATPDDAALDRQLIALGCAYDSPLGDRAWLAQVARKVRAGARVR